MGRAVDVMSLPRSIEEEIREYLREHKALDLRSTLEKISEDQRRLFEKYMSHDAEDRERHAETMGDLKGISLRVLKLEEADKELSKDIDDSRRWHIESLEKGGERQHQQLTWIRQNWFLVAGGALAWLVSTAVAIVALFKK
jgi:hypothetical protein